MGREPGRPSLTTPRPASVGRVTRQLLAVFTVLQEAAPAAVPVALVGERAEVGRATAFRRGSDLVRARIATQSRADNHRQLCLHPDWQSSPAAAAILAGLKRGIQAPERV